MTDSLLLVLQGVLEKTHLADVTRVANQMLISTLTENLASMEPSTKRSTVSTSHYFFIIFSISREELSKCLSSCEPDWECVLTAGQAGCGSERKGSVHGVELRSSTHSGVSERERTPPHSSDAFQPARALTKKAPHATEWEGLNFAFAVALFLLVFKRSYV